jgi:hypothetical protein
MVLLQESSAIGDYDDALDNPGSSRLWVGKDWHLNRDEVQQLTSCLTHWLRCKRLPVLDSDTVLDRESNA